VFPKETAASAVRQGLPSSVFAGSLPFISRATEYRARAFWIKMVLIAVAGINMIIFVFITISRSAEMEP
jgi:hypothetical protein